MSKKTIWIWVAVIIAVLIAWWFYMQAPEPEQTQQPEQTQETQQPEQGSITIQLSAQNDSGQSGTAVISAIEGGSRVVVSLNPIEGSNNQPMHIHTGTCADIGGVKYPLTNLINGSSETMLNVSVSDLLREGDLAINAHKSAEEISVYTSCGDL